MGVEQRLGLVRRDPRQCHDQGQLEAPAAACQDLGRAVIVDARQLAEDAAERMRSFSLVGWRSIIRLPSVLPIRTIAPVEIMFRTILVAVPALSRVEPAMISGPTRARSPGRPAAQQARAVAGDADGGRPADRASRTAPSTYGVRPDVAMPTTRSR